MPPMAAPRTRRPSSARIQIAPTIPEAVADNLEAIRNEHKAIKLRLREYEAAFEQRHGRKPRKKKDWAQVYHDYERYEALREAEKIAKQADTERFVDTLRLKVVIRSP